jgi:O-antigen/teichoic acid export membrane protein
MSDLKRDFFWNTVGNISNFLFDLLLVIAVTRTMGLEISGIYTFSVSVRGVWIYLSNFGGYLFQITDSKNQFSARDYLISRMGGILMVLIVGTSYILASGFDFFRIGVLVAMLAQTVVGMLSSVLHAVMQTGGRLYTAGKIITLKSVISIVLSVGCLYFFQDLVAAVFLNVLGNLFVLIAFEFPIARKLEPLSLAPYSLRAWAMILLKIVKASYLNFLNGLVIPLIAFIPRFYIELFHPESQGIFGLLFMPFTMIVLLGSYIYNPMIVPISKAIRDEKYQFAYKKLNSLIGLSAIITAILLPLVFVFAKQIYGLVYNVDITGYIWVLILITIIGFLQLTMDVLFIAFQIFRKLWANFVVNVLLLIIVLILGWFLIPDYSVYGAVEGTLLGLTLTTIFSYILFRKYFKELAV